MWLLYQEADTWSTTPSTLLGVDDEYAAYCLNQAVAYVGKFIDGEMDKAASGAKNEKAAASARDRVLKHYLDARPDKSTSRFADPAMMFQ